MDPYRLSHPEELLEAYSLGILEEEEALDVESHMAVCSRCRSSVGRLQSVAASLAESLDQQAPPPSVGVRLMDAIPDIARAVYLREDKRERSPRVFPLKRVLLPLAAILVLGLFSVNLVATLLLDGQVEELQAHNTSLNRLEKLAADEAQVFQSLNELREFASHWLIDTPSLPLVLEPPGRKGRSEGLLLVAEDGRQAMLMVAGMRKLPEPLSYQVMLKRQGQQPLWVGQLKVDATGRGNVALHIPDEPIFAFDKVMLTADADAVRGIAEDGMVLEGQIIARNLSK